MAALTNTVKAADISKAFDIEMQENFKGELDALNAVLGIVQPEVIAAGSALYVYRVTGTLQSGDVAEGDEIPLSNYQVDKNFIGETELKKYRKLTTHEAVLKGGRENAILRTDTQMIRDIRKTIINKFFSWMKITGTQFTYGATLQAALAQAEATLEDELEKTGNAGGRIVHFVNRFDIADYLATANVSTQTLFGMNYLQNFLGVNDIFVSSYTPKGKVFVTPAENIHMYGVDFGELAACGSGYTSIVNSLIATKHTPSDERGGFNTFVESGCTLLAEATNFICEARIGKAATDTSVTKDDLTAFANARSIDISSATTKDAILAAIVAKLPNFC